MPYSLYAKKANYASSAGKIYTVGEYAQGGVVFYVDETGHHGLVVAMNDLPSSTWSNAGSPFMRSGAKSAEIFAGKKNTMLIMSKETPNYSSSEPTFAAWRASNYTVTQNGFTYGDWFLPSVKEMDLMRINKAVISPVLVANGGTDFLTNTAYWTSTEINLIDYAFVYNFGGTSPGSFTATTHKSNSSIIRPVRSF